MEGIEIQQVKALSGVTLGTVAEQRFGCFPLKFLTAALNP